MIEIPLEERSSETFTAQQSKDLAAIAKSIDVDVTIINSKNKVLNVAIKGDPSKVAIAKHRISQGLQQQVRHLIVTLIYGFNHVLI